MDCEHVRAALSARMDGERLSPSMGADVERHLGTCRGCSAFERTAWRLRERTRFEPAPAVPDLVEPIMTAVRREAASRIGTAVRAGTPVRPGAAGPPPRIRSVRAPAFPRRGRRPIAPARLAPVAAALVIGLVAGSVAVGGPWRRAGRTTLASAAEVSRGVTAAATHLSSYQARFAITERDFATDIPVRELSMDVWFQAPDRFRLDVNDRTRYPGRGRTPTDLQLVVNGSASSTTAPSACPVGVCPPRTTVVANRVPFSGPIATPTDLILPMTALGDPGSVRVVGHGTVLGRPAVEVRLTFEQAEPLFPFLSMGGSWRPFFPGDRVELWLDAAGWFPLRYEVFPAGGRERAAWALRFGLPPEAPGRAIFRVAALSVSQRTPPPSTFRIPEGRMATDQGAREVPLADLPREAGFQPVTPAEVDGLDAYRAVLPAPADRSSGRQTLITYSRGLTWLKLGEARGWAADEPYGPIGPHAEEVRLPSGGVGYYEPATDEHGRRLSIHADGTDLYLETNLPREQLLRIAASLPVVGVPIPASWSVRRSSDGITVRLPLDEAAARLSFPLVVPGPGTLPAGSTLASAELVTVQGVTGMTLYFQQVDTDLGIGPIRLHEEPGTALPPASAASQSRVEVRGLWGRWTPDRNQLEWVQDGVYCSIDAAGLDLPALLAVADGLVPFAAPASPSRTPSDTPAVPPSDATAPPIPASSPGGEVLP